MALTELTKITGPGIKTDTNWVGNNANYTGIVTAVSFVGDGSSLTGIANTDFIVGTAITMGTANFTGNVTIGGTLTYEDVTNIDSVGIITAQSDIHVGAGISAVGVISATSFVGDGAVTINNNHTSRIITGSGTPNTLNGNLNLNFDGTSLKIGSGVTISRHGDGFFTGVVTATSFVGSGANLTGVNADRLDGINGANFLRSDTSDTMTGDLTLQGFSPDLNFVSTTNNPDWKITNYEGTLVFYDITNSANKFLMRTNEFVSEEIIKARDGMNVVGVATFQDIDVDGHTNLDNVSVAGVTTTSGSVSCGGDLDITGQYLKIENAASPEIQLTDTNAGNSLCFIRNSSGNLRLAADNNNAVADTSIRFLVDGGEKVRITSAGKVLIGTSTPQGNANADDLVVSTSGHSGITIRSGTSSNGNIFFADGTSGGDEYRGVIDYNHSSNHMSFSTNAVERLRIISTGQVRIGNENNLGLWGQNNRLQVAGTDWNTSGVTIACMSNSGSANLVMGNSKASTPGGSGGALTQDNRLAYISFVGDDGTDMNTVGAAIVAELDSNASSNSMPARLRFYTGGNSSERLRITSTGAVTISGNRNQVAPTTYDDLTGTNQAGLLIGSGGITDAGIMLRTSSTGTGRIYFGDNSGSDAGRKQGRIEYYNNGDYMQFATAGTERLRISEDTNGRYLGRTPLNPAESAEEIKNDISGTPDNDWYYIKQFGNVARLHYCVFKDQNGNDIAGGPWTMNWIAGVHPNQFSSNGPTSISRYLNLCKKIGIDKPGRGMESSRTTAQVYGAWLAVKRALWDLDPGFFQGASTGSGGVLIMPILNINGEGGSSDHRVIYSSATSTHIPPNQDGDHCNANQLFCGWWGGNDFSSWATNNNSTPSPEDWGPGDVAHTGDIGALSNSTPQKPSWRDKMLVTCIYK